MSDNLKYKIEVKEHGSNYKITVLKKWWIFWLNVESKIMAHSYVNISKQIVDYQNRFNIPDEKIIIKGV